MSQREDERRKIPQKLLGAMSHSQDVGDPILPPSPSLAPRSFDPHTNAQPLPPISRSRSSVISWPASYEVHEFGARSRSSRPSPTTISHESSYESFTPASPNDKGISLIQSSLHVTTNPFSTPPSTPGASVKSFESSAISPTLPPTSVVIERSESQYSLPSGTSTSINLSRAASSSRLNSTTVNSSLARNSMSNINNGPLLQRRARRERSFVKPSPTMMSLSISTPNINLNMTPPSSPPANPEKSPYRDTFASPPTFPPGIISSGASTPSMRTSSSKHVNSWRIPSTLSDEKGFLFDLSGVDETLKAMKTHEKDLTPSDSSVSLTDGYFSVEKDRDLPIRPSALVLGTIHKPWLEKKDWRVAASWWITFTIMLMGFGAAAVICVVDYFSVPLITSPLCMILDENFDTLDLNGTWSRIVDMSGFQNGEFEMTTDSSNNSYVKDGILYIVPTLTSDVIGVANVFDAFSYNVTGCTNTVDFNGCGAVSNATAGTVIPPIMSGRLTTQFSHSLTYGKVEIRARMPQGDWIWPTLWMLPVNNTYGPWPASGEIDIAFSRGNGITYPADGQNFIRSSLNWGPTVALNREFKTFGLWSNRRKSFAKDFHTYTLEWTSDYLRVYVDSRTSRSLEIRFNTPFFARGSFPDQIMNGTATVPLQNPWKGRGNSAPFDQPFYLILSLSVGGTDGVFPDNVGGKPWLDASQSAMKEFALAQDQWYPTWPANLEERGLAVDYVKMWKTC